ncbi:MAG: hypothetical protein C0174_01625 [Thermodesulfobium narugense]|nr:MAG: hypothetical protein C0174_01625 [Thermodesulfobium narugense]
MLLEIIVKLDMASFEEAHKLSSQIEQRIYEKFPNVDNVIVHYEPIKKEIIKICIPQTKYDQISEHFGNSSSFLIIDYDLSKQKILNKQQKPNDFLELKEKKGIQTALYLVKEGVDIIVTTKHIENTGPYFVFKTHNKKFYIVDNVQIDNLEELLKKISNKIYVKQMVKKT